MTVRPNHLGIALQRHRRAGPETRTRAGSLVQRRTSNADGKLAMDRLNSSSARSEPCIRTTLADRG
jgi:hypothetical protein